MGLLKVVSGILGQGDAISKGIDLIDDMHTSKEEEIQAIAKAKVDILAAYAPFKIAQRLIGLGFIATYLLCFLTILVMAMLGTLNTDNAREVISEFYIAEITFTIVGFYFGGGFIEGGLKARGGSNGKD